MDRERESPFKRRTFHEKPTIGCYPSNTWIPTGQYNQTRVGDFNVKYLAQDDKRLMS